MACPIPIKNITIENYYETKYCLKGIAQSGVVWYPYTLKHIGTAQGNAAVLSPKDR